MREYRGGVFMIGKRIRYWTMNSWNESKSLAYNMKIYNIFPIKYRHDIYALMDEPDAYSTVNCLISAFTHKYNYKWQAGFNGRSGGYLVLYSGGVRDGRPYCQPGLDIEDKDVPAEVKKDFRKLAVDIYKAVLDDVK